MLEEDSESALVREASQGNKKAFEELYRTHVDGVYTLALRMTGEIQAAEDITQEIFIRVWRKIETFRGKSAFGTWLYRLSMNEILRRRRQLNRRPVPLQDRDIRVSEEDPADKAAIRLDLQNAISGLPFRCRGVLILHDLMGYNHREIAGIMKITPGTSKAHLHKAKNLLNRELKR